MKKVSNNALIFDGSANDQIILSKLTGSSYLEKSRNFNERACTIHFVTIILYPNIRFIGGVIIHERRGL